MSAYDVPQRLIDLLGKWCGRLVEHRWEVKASIVNAPADDPECSASTVNSALYRDSSIRINVNNEDWTPEQANEYIAHEVLHIAHANIDYTVRQVIIENLVDESAQGVALEAYRLAVEQFVTSLSRLLCEWDTEGQGDDN